MCNRSMSFARARHCLIRLTLTRNTTLQFSSSAHQDLYSINTNITSCFNRGDVISARKLFDEMTHRNIVTYNCMVSGFVRSRMISHARQVFDAIPDRNVVSWTAIISGYIGCGELKEARKLFDRIPEGVKNAVCWDVMLKGYVKKGRLKEARELFDQAPERSIGLYNRMLSGYADKGMIDEARDLFSSMSRRDVVSWTSMIACFSRAGLMGEARRMFDGMPFEKDVRVWTTVVQGYMQNGMVDEACGLFNEMPARDVVVWNCMVSGCVQNGRVEEAMKFYKRMPTRDVVASNSVLHGLVRSGKLADAQRFFRNEMLHKDVASWNTLISGYQTDHALTLYNRMLRHGFRPDEATYTTMISICSALALHGWGRALHASVIKTGYVPNRMIESSLMSMYSKCGQIGHAAVVFGSMEERDAVAWNTMILAQAYHGSAETALGLFDSMVEAECKPNHVTFLAVLTTCAHSGLLEDGKRYLRSMQQDWNIAPRPEHIACVADMLSRSGLLHEAYELVAGLPDASPTYAWEALLSCCKLHGNLELGELVAQKILQNKPSNVEI